MGCPEGWLDWDAYGVLIQARVWAWLSTSITCGFFLFKSLSAGAELPQKPHYIEWSHNKDKVLTDTWSFKEAEALTRCEILQRASWTMFTSCFPSCVICHSHFFVLRELLTHWKCTKEYNKDMCHTLHPYYAGNDKWDKQSLQHTVCSALRLTLLTARVQRPQSLCEMSI